MKKFVFPKVLPGCLYVALGLFSPTVRAATTRTVTSLGDSGAGSLRKAIADSTAGDVIVFGVKGAITLTSGRLILDKTIAIRGPGATDLTVQRSAVTTTDDFGIFDISDISGTGTYVISGLTIRNGRTGGSGSGVQNSGNLTLSNSVITSNFGGSAVAQSGFGTMTIRNCTISNNQGTPDGLESTGGAIFNTGSMTIVDSTIAGNTATIGGGIWNNGNLTLTRATVKDNTAQFAGGGVYLVGGDLLIQDSAVSGNRVTDGQGGGIFATTDVDLGALDTKLQIVSCTINNNSAEQSGDVPSGSGAGVYNNATEATISNSTISGNRANFNGGGMRSFTPITVTNCTFTQNTAAAGGGISTFVDPDSGEKFPATVGNTILAGNTASTGPDGHNAFTSNGYNLVGIASGSSGFSAAKQDLLGTSTSPLNARLGPLANNGGTTLTHALLGSSPAVDQGKSSLNDQTGQTRPFDISFIDNAAGGNGSDIGALEFRGVAIGINNPRSIDEGNAGSAGFTQFAVSLSAPATQTVSVAYKTTDNTAKAGTDYVAQTGTLTFAAGQTRKIVRIDFIGESLVESNETFFLDLQTPTGAPLADNRSVAFIRNDDGPRIAIDNALAVDEGPAPGAPAGTRSQTFAVRLSAASTSTVTVDWATANNTAGPADYVVASGTLTFAPGQTQKLITVQIKGDALVEPTETYRVLLSRPALAVIADNSGIGYIRNDDGSAPISANDEPSE